MKIIIKILIVIFISMLVYNIFNYLESQKVEEYITDKTNNTINNNKHYPILVCTKYAVYDNEVGDCIEFTSDSFLK